MADYRKLARRIRPVYYTIEGKRFLLLLYFLGLFLGSFLMNLAVRMDFFEEVSLFQFMTYLKDWSLNETASLFSYILFIRLRQLIIFFACVLLFSPYVIFCIIDFAVSFLAGGFLSCAVMYYGPGGLIKGTAVFLPHGLCYFLALALVYFYLFQRNTVPLSYRSAVKGARGFRFWRYRIGFRAVVAAEVIFLFMAGCYLEAVVSPWLLKMIA